MKQKPSFWITSTAIHGAIILMLILFSRPFRQEHIISEPLSISSMETGESSPAETPAPVENKAPVEDQKTQPPPVKEEEHKAVLEKEQNEISTKEPQRKIIPKPVIREAPPPPKIESKLKSQLKNILKDDPAPVAENDDTKKKES